MVAQHIVAGRHGIGTSRCQGALVHVFTFRDIPDFQADMLRVYSSGDTVWAKWR